jgi:L-histidine Nalpha-methyltransferase
MWRAGTAGSLSTDNRCDPESANSRCRFDVHADALELQAMLEEDVRRGLSARPRWLPPKYFYDETGAKLFDRITTLPEYYLTRVEESLIGRFAREIVQGTKPSEIVELGPGSCRKVRPFLDAVDPSSGISYLPIDVGRDSLASAVSDLMRDHPWLRVHAVVGDFERHLARFPSPVGRRLVLFLGSTIGNFDPTARQALLTQIRHLVGSEGRLLLGVDLVKDRRVLEAAYNDAAGVTRAFNRNILCVVNRAVQGDFCPAAFRHLAFYSTTEHRIEMHLIAAAPQRVHLRRLGMRLEFAEGEGIWTENSYKFTRTSVEAMLVDAQLSLENWYTDQDERFALILARPIESR